jgi:hypothetical protein
VEVTRLVRKIGRTEPATLAAVLSVLERIFAK